MRGEPTYVRFSFTEYPLLRDRFWLICYGIAMIIDGLSVFATLTTGKTSLTHKTSMHLARRHYRREKRVLSKHKVSVAYQSGIRARAAGDPEFVNPYFGIDNEHLEHAWDRGYEGIPNKWDDSAN